MIVTQDILDRIVERAKEFHATKIILFGSALHAPLNARDIDLACDISGLDIFLFAGLAEEEFRVPIDVIPLTPASPFTEYISAHGRVLYDASHGA